MLHRPVEDPLRHRRVKSHVNEPAPVAGRTAVQGLIMLSQCRTEASRAKRQGLEWCKPKSSTEHRSLGITGFPRRKGTTISHIQASEQFRRRSRDIESLPRFPQKDLPPNLQIRHLVEPDRRGP